MKNEISRNKIVAAFIVLASMTLNGCATSDIKNIISDGNAVSTSQSTLPKINPKKVKLFYSNNEKLHHYKIVGRVSAENYSIVGMEHTQATIADELKKQAASIGANGVININSGMAQTTGDAVIIK